LNPGSCAVVAAGQVDGSANLAGYDDHAFPVGFDPTADFTVYIDYTRVNADAGTAINVAFNTAANVPVFNIAWAADTGNGHDTMTISYPGFGPAVAVVYATPANGPHLLTVTCAVGGGITFSVDGVVQAAGPITPVPATATTLYLVVAQSTRTRYYLNRLRLYQ
jgi:hypothetical protein